MGGFEINEAPSPFFEIDADIDSRQCNRIHSEIDELGLVILVFDVGTTQETRLNVKKQILDFVRSITSKKFKIGVVKEMMLDEFGQSNENKEYLHIGSLTGEFRVATYIQQESTLEKEAN